MAIQQADKLLKKHKDLHCAKVSDGGAALTLSVEFVFSAAGVRTFSCSDHSHMFLIASRLFPDSTN